MTRENKLALVVGFGLILLVGILISDHFSNARNPEAAELTRAIDPLAPPRTTPADLIAMRTAEPSAQGRDARIPARRVETPRKPAGIEMGGTPPAAPVVPAAAVGLPPAVAEALPYRFHTVASGESLSAICADHYGDPSLAVELAKYNDIDRPDRVFAGTRLRLPSAGDLVRGGTTGRAASRASAPPSETSDGTARETTYTVKKGDMLTGIASRLLGSPAKYEVIFEHNRDKLKDPDDITPGMVLRIP